MTPKLFFQQAFPYEMKLSLLQLLGMQIATRHQISHLKMPLEL